MCGCDVLNAACATVLPSAESRVRMENLLGVMMRLRNARNLDSRQTNAVDSAYFACRPPDKAMQRRRRPPLRVRCCCAAGSITLEVALLPRRCPAQPPNPPYASAATLCIRPMHIV